MVFCARSILSQFTKIHLKRNVCSRQQTLFRTASTAPENSEQKLIKQYDILNPYQKKYLDRIRKDFATAQEASLQRHNAASDRFISKFTTLNSAYLEYCETLDSIVECHGLLGEDGMEDIAASEIRSLVGQLADTYDNIRMEISDRLIPTNGDILLEIRAATGGMESSMFCHDLKTVYHNVAISKGYSWNVLEEDFSGPGSGISKMEVEISGADVFGTFQFEAGVHRVQRVPVNDTRIHTSTAVVLVTAKPDDIHVEINPEDLDITYTTARGPGGQFVNRIRSKCLMKHKPSGFETSSQVHRIAEQNMRECLKKIHHMLMRQELDLRLSQSEQSKKKQALHGDRSDKMRTYNFKADKIIDHRYKVSASGIIPYFSDPETFLSFHKEVSLAWQLQELSQLIEEL